MAQRSNERGEAARTGEISRASIDKGRLEGGLNDGLVFGDREIVGLRVREP